MIEEGRRFVEVPPVEAVGSLPTLSVVTVGNLQETEYKDSITFSIKIIEMYIAQILHNRVHHRKNLL